MGRWGRQGKGLGEQNGGGGELGLVGCSVARKGKGGWMASWADGGEKEGGEMDWLRGLSPREKKMVSNFAKKDLRGIPKEI